MRHSKFIVSNMKMENKTNNRVQKEYYLGEPEMEQKPKVACRD